MTKRKLFYSTELIGTNLTFVYMCPIKLYQGSTNNYMKLMKRSPCPCLTLGCHGHGLEVKDDR